MFEDPGATGGHSPGSPEAPRPASWALTPETHGTRDREAQATSAPSAHAEPPGHTRDPALHSSRGGGGGVRRVRTTVRLSLHRQAQSLRRQDGRAGVPVSSAQPSLTDVHQDGVSSLPEHTTPRALAPFVRGPGPWHTQGPPPLDKQAVGRARGLPTNRACGPSGSGVTPCLCFG